MCVSSMATMNNKQKWTKTFKRLQAYQQEHGGSCNVPSKYRQDLHLGRWVDKQRTTYRKGLLAKERCDQLEKIGFEWTVVERTKWTEMLKRLQQYIPNKWRANNK